MNVSFFQELLTTISERGQALMDRSFGGPGSLEMMGNWSLALLSGRGESSGVAIARKILDTYRGLSDDEKLAYFHFLAEGLLPDHGPIEAAARAYLDEPTADTLSALGAAVESPRQEFFRRLNLAPGATAEIVAMRADLLKFLSKDDTLMQVNSDLTHLLRSWFNRGFLVAQRIDWSTSASILEKIIQYEAVHQIRGWDELRRRLDPRDRRCFAFFHPSLVDEPLIFVEVALSDEIPGSIQNLLAEEGDDNEKKTPNTAVFYSISNCQAGLSGISFGNFLIKQVAQDLASEIPSLKTFVTLSPMPRFAAWLERTRADADELGLSDADRETLSLLQDPGWAAHANEEQSVRSVLLPLAARYLVQAKTRRDAPVDPVARFHLGNGARLERINWLGDKSAKGFRQAHGLMVNYLYDLGDIEKNHEAYANSGTVNASRSVKALLKSSDRQKVTVAAE